MKIYSKDGAFKAFSKTDDKGKLRYYACDTQAITVLRVGNIEQLLVSNFENKLIKEVE